MVTINGVEFEIDLMDADTMERFEDAAEKIQKGVEAARAKKVKNSGYIREFNKLTEEFLDEVLGEGSSDLIFAGSQNMMLHMECYKGIFDAKNAAMKDVTDFADEFKLTYSPNRAQRRAVAKQSDKS